MSHFNPSVFEAVLDARNLSIPAIANRIEQSPEALSNEIRSEQGPKRGILNAIAHELAVPAFVFYMKEAPTLTHAIPDFRATQPTALPKSRDTIKVIDIASRLQEIAIAKGAKFLFPIEGSLSVFNVEVFAANVRRNLKISNADQRNAKSALDFYRLCRQRIEGIGVFVFQDSFPSEDGSGFCLYKPDAPVIVINTKDQNPSRRLFTLLHELAHVILGQTGISDPFVRKNSVEVLCNRFAAAFLMPKPFVLEVVRDLNIAKTASREEIARAARKLKSSQQATVLRLERLQVLENGSYASWLAAVRATTNPDYLTNGFGSGIRAPEEKFKLAKFGFHFAKIFSGAISKGALSPIELYRACGLKPKWQKSYFELALNASYSDMGD